MRTQAAVVSPAEINDLYERLRRQVIEARPGRRDALAVLRRQGVAAWIAEVAAAPPRPARVPTTQAPAPGAGPAVTTDERSPLVFLCTDMLLATLAAKEQMP